MLRRNSESSGAGIEAQRRGATAAQSGRNGRDRRDGRTQARGEKSRAAILIAAAELATTRGLEGLSIGDLAGQLQMSKSGLYAHFKSKQDLQLATIETAADIFDREVLAPAMKAPPGAQRLVALAEKFLSHVKRRVFPGGCFFAAAAAEMGMRPGAVRDRVVQTVQDWLSLLQCCVRDAQRQAQIDPAADAAQIAFEVEAMLMAANALFIVTADPRRLTQARRGIKHLLEQYTP